MKPSPIKVELSEGTVEQKNEKFDPYSSHLRVLFVARMSQIQKMIEFNDVDQHGRTPLHHACCLGQFEVVN